MSEAVIVAGGRSTPIQNLPAAPSAPAAGAAPYVSDTSGMSASQAAAMRYVDITRAAVAKDPTGHSTFTLRQQHREALAHAFHGEAAPAWLQTGEQKSAEQVAAGMRESEPLGEALAPAWAPASDSELDSVRHGATLNGMASEVADAFVTVAKAMQLPASHARNIAGRIAIHHRELGGDLQLSDDERADYLEQATHALGGVERATEVVESAMAYLDSVGMLKQLENTSLIYDPAILITLASLQTSKGK